MQLFKKMFSFRGLLALLFIALTFQIVAPDIAFAASSSDKGVLGSLAELLGVLISVLTFISLLMMKFFGQLLGTNMLTGPEAMQALTPMWVWVRNLTNILFVIVLVGLAFSNLFASFSGENGGNWTIKEKLPKVIIALVAINFSLLAFRVVIDAVNVGTVAILGIADSRLDADNPEQQDAMIKAKTWVMVPEKVYNKLDKIDFDGDVKAGKSCSKEYKEKIGTRKKVLAFTKLVDKETRYYACRDFRSQVNDLFCNGWEKKKYDELGKKEEDLDDDCLFILKKDTFKTFLSPDDEPGQNLFMSFGTVFMHLERLPALGAQINSLNGVILNTLFSSILSIAYIVALVVVFIALLTRVIVLWIAMVFSPLLIAASIMGFGEGKAGEATEKLVTNLIMPLKIAAAFAVSFVMMSGMIEFGVVQQGDAFLFGPALSNLGIAEYGFLWQMATIVVFWMAARWATEGNLAHDITEKIFTGAETLGKFAAEAATINRPLFAINTGKGEQKFSMSNILAAPVKMADLRMNKNAQRTQELANYLAGADAQSKFATNLPTADWSKVERKGIVEEFQKFQNVRELDANRSGIIKALKRSGQDYQKKIAEYLEKNEDKKASEALHEYFQKHAATFGYSATDDMRENDFYKGDGEKTGDNDKDSAKNETKAEDHVGDTADKEDKTLMGRNISELPSIAEKGKKFTTDRGDEARINAGDIEELTSKGTYKDKKVDLFKDAIKAEIKVETDIKSNTATINTGEKGIVSLAESKNGAVKVMLVEQNGKTPITNAFGVAADNNQQITINNSLIGKVKDKLNNNPGKLTHEEKEILKTIKTLKDFILKNDKENINKENRTFINNIEIPAETDN